MRADGEVEHPEPDSGRRPERIDWAVVGSLLISIACGLVYPVVGGGPVFWSALGVLLLVALALALARSSRRTRRRQSNA